MVNLGQVFLPDIILGKERFDILVAHDTVLWYHLMLKYIQLGVQRHTPSIATAIR